MLRALNLLVSKVDQRFFSEYFKDTRFNRELNDNYSILKKRQPWQITTNYTKDPNDLLSILCDRYGSDKGESQPGPHPYPWPSHSYADYYSRIFAGKRMTVKRVFECGIGTNNPNFPSSMQKSGKPGASLRVWNDYFPNALIFGADIDTDVLFEDGRIKTLYIDQLNTNSISNFWENVGLSDFDFILDDGLHTYDAGVNLFVNSIKYLSDGGIYVIEDVSVADLLRYEIFFKSHDYAV